MCAYAVTNFMPDSCAMEVRSNRGLLAEVHAAELLGNDEGRLLVFPP